MGAKSQYFDLTIDEISRHFEVRELEPSPDGPLRAVSVRNAGDGGRTCEVNTPDGYEAHVYAEGLHFDDTLRGAASTHVVRLVRGYMENGATESTRRRWFGVVRVVSVDTPGGATYNLEEWGPFSRVRVTDARRPSEGD